MGSAWPGGDSAGVADFRGSAAAGCSVLGNLALGVPVARKLHLGLAMTLMAFHRSAASAASLSVLVLLGGGCWLDPAGHGTDWLPPDETWLSLSELTNPRVLVQIEQNESDYLEWRNLAVTIEYDDPVGPRDQCPVLLSLGARIGEEDLLGRYGGWSAREGGERVCEAPSLAMRFDEAARVGDRVLHVGDESRTISAPIGDGLLRRRALLSAPPFGGFAVGDTVSVRWLPAADLDTALPTFEVVSAAGAVVATISGADLTHSGDALSFPVPPSLAGLGAGRLRLTRVTSSPGCDGACIVRTSHRVGMWLQVR